MRILVFGGTSGIGEAVVNDLRFNNHSVLTCSRRETADIRVDATSPQGVALAFQVAKERLGGIDGVVNSIGSVLLKPVGSITDDEWSQYMQTNILTAFNIMREAVNYLTNANGGSIVMFSAAAGSIGMRKHEAIATAKSAINGLVMSSAATYASKGIRINAVAPALVRTPMTESFFQTEKSIEACKALHPIGRTGETSDVAPVVRMLLENTWITGQIINVDGGLTSIK